MENETTNINEPVPYIVHEGTMVRMERTNRRLWISTLVLIVVLVLTNGAWIVYESQFEDTVTETYTAETDSGGTAIANGTGTVTVNGNESDLLKNNNANP